MDIVFLLFPNLTQLDMTAPAQMLSRLPDARLHYAAASMAPVPTDCGFSILPTTDFDGLPACDLLCVPGGGGVAPALGDPATVDFVRRAGAQARHVTSVCTGAFLLGAAGLLRGKRATTHWGYVDLLARVGAIHTAGRVVQDGTTITGGGVTAGLDFGLTVLAEIGGQALAETVQLSFEYDPAPPFDAGSPDRAPAAARQAVAPRYDMAAARMAAALDALP